MSVKKIKENIYSVGVEDYDRRLFDSLIPLPDGTSYNSYIIKGSEKTALIDTVDPNKEEQFLRHLDETGIDKIDYIVANHAEQDHSGVLGTVLDRYPEATVLASEKCKDLLVEFGLAASEKIKPVKDGDTVSLGDKTLEFMETPWVHWPETILTYLKEDAVLFPCDLFGSHLAVSSLYADTDSARLMLAAKRYFAEIMMPFSKLIKGYLDRLDEKKIDIIAASHGPVYDKPDYIMDLYRKWVGENKENTVVLPYVSMHGSTLKAVEYFIDALSDRGVKVEPFDLTVSDVGELAAELVDSATLVVATPTVLGGAHPVVLNAVYLANALRPSTKYLSIICSYGWGGRAIQQISDNVKNIKAEVIDPVLFKGLPDKEAYKALDELAETISEKHKELK